MVWNIPLVSSGQLSWLCPLPRSCPPRPTVGGKMSERALVLCKHYSAVATIPVCYQHPASSQHKTQYHEGCYRGKPVLAQPDPVQLWTTNRQWIMGRSLANGAWALKGHYWICGHTAYKQLPAKWSGICYVGIIRPLLFLLPEAGAPQLGIRLHDNLGDKRIAHNKQSVEVKIGGTQKWGKMSGLLKE